MPYTHRRGYLKMSRESSPGVLSTSQLPGINNGPLSVMAAPTFAGGTTNLAMGIPSLTRDMEPTYFKHTTPMQVGRRYEDVQMVAGRRQTMGTLTVPATPNAFGLWLFLLFGVDVVTAAQSTTTTGAANTANSVTLNVTATTAAITAGQRIWINDGANTEYVQVATGAASGAVAIAITGGGGTGGGLKFTHAATTPIQFGPWTHVFTPSNAANGIPTFQVEDNFGGHANSMLYTTCSVDSLEIAANIEAEADALQATLKIVGTAPATAGGIVGSGSFSLPVEEVPMVPGNAAVWTNPPNASLPSAPFNNIYVPDFKATVTNNAKLVKAAVGSPDPYTTLVTNFHMRGSADTIFEDYGVFNDYISTKIWSPVDLKFNWATQALQGNLGPVSPSLDIKIQRFGIDKANKETVKDDIVRLPIESWKALDMPDFGTPAITQWTLVNNVAAY